MKSLPQLSSQVCIHPYRAKPYQLALPIKKSLHDVIGIQQNVCASVKILISLLSMLYLQKVLLIHLNKCVFYIIYELKLTLRVSFKNLTHCNDYISITSPQYDPDIYGIPLS